MSFLRNLAKIYFTDKVLLWVTQQLVTLIVLHCHCTASSLEGAVCAWNSHSLNNSPQQQQATASVTRKDFLLYNPLLAADSSSSNPNVVCLSVVYQVENCLLIAC